MANNLAELYIEVKAKTDQLDKDLNALKSKVGGAGKASGESFGGGFVTAMKASGIIAGIAGIIAVIKTSISNSIAASKAQIQIGQALKTTGNAAGYTSKELVAMADKLEIISGISRTDILDGVTRQLLTFTNIAGPAFDRAQKAALDLSAVIGTDLKGQTIQLGKALEDPVKGVNALTRSGVTFTAQQKEQIKTLVQSNKIYEAQSIILTEIEAKYGGQAEAANKADVGLGNLAANWKKFTEGIGSFILPGIETLVSGLKTLATWLGIVQEETKNISGKELVNQLIKAEASLSTINEARLSVIGEINQELNKQLSYLEGHTSAIKSSEDALTQIENKTKLINAADKERLSLQVQFNKATGEDKLAIGSKILQTEEVIANEKTQLGVLNDVIKLNNDIASVQGDINSGKKEGNIITTKTIADAKEQTDYVKEIREKVAQLKIEYAQISSSLVSSNLTLQERNALITREIELRKELKELDLKSPEARGTDKPKTDFVSLVQPVSEIESPLVGVLTDAEKLDLVLQGVGETMYGLADAASFFGSAFSQESAAYKAAAVIQATVATYLAAAKALTLGPIIGPIAAAAVTIAGLANVSKIMSAHTGGTFENGRKVASFARGGDFMVPPGYSNDSFPMLVESGERVQVTPKGAVGNQDKLLSQLISETRAMNRNIVNQSRGDIRLDVDGKELALIVQSNLNRLSSAGFDTQFV